MAPLDDKKVEWTSPKQAVTVAANRLKTGCEYKMDSVGEMASKLDTAFCDSVEISTEYREMCTDEEASDDYLVVNGLDLDSYEQSVKVVYSEAISHQHTILLEVILFPVKIILTVAYTLSVEILLNFLV